LPHTTSLFSRKCSHRVRAGYFTVTLSRFCFSSSRRRESSPFFSWENCHFFCAERVIVSQPPFEEPLFPFQVVQPHPPSFPSDCSTFIWTRRHFSARCSFVFQIPPSQCLLRNCGAASNRSCQKTGITFLMRKRWSFLRLFFFFFEWNPSAAVMLFFHQWNSPFPFLRLMRTFPPPFFFFFRLSPH